MLQNLSVCEVQKYDFFSQDFVTIEWVIFQKKNNEWQKYKNFLTLPGFKTFFKNRSAEIIPTEKYVTSASEMRMYYYFKK